MSLEGRVSGERINRLRQMVLERALEKKQFLTEQFWSSGYPPGAQPKTPYEQYRTLIMMREQNDPSYWESPEAQRALERLGRRFGAPPPALVPVQPVIQPAPQPQLPQANIPQLLAGMVAGGVTRNAIGSELRRQ